MIHKNPRGESRIACYDDAVVCARDADVFRGHTMTNVRPYRTMAVTFACWLSVVSFLPAQQDTLASAKEFYASAAYDEALQVLAKLKSDPTSSEATEIAAYQVFCFVALGRSAEARQAAETMVRLNPLYHPPDAETSPRVRAFLEDVRRPLLPDIARQ